MIVLGGELQRLLDALRATLIEVTRQPRFRSSMRVAQFVQMRVEVVQMRLEVDHLCATAITLFSL